MIIKNVIALFALLSVAACSDIGTQRNIMENGLTQQQRAAVTQVQLGRGYLDEGKLELAMEKLRRALELDPKNTDAHTVIAVLFERIGNSKQAEMHYRKAVSLRPDGGNELNNLGSYLCHQNQFDEADQMFVKALEDPFYKTPAVAHANAGICALDAGHFERAESALRSALAADPNYNVYLPMAKVMMAKKDYLRARAFVQRSEEVQKPSAESLMLSAKIEAALGDDKASAEYLNQLHTNFPDAQEEKHSSKE
jgi:type IV pilus assembly protein PilF